MENDAHENFDDIVEQKIFKYKYRQNADDSLTFERRYSRVADRFLERAKTRDPLLEQDLAELFASDARDTSLATLALEPSKFRNVAEEETRPFREYMVSEALQQYRDYYESDDEEQRFFEYMDNLTNRDKIRFMEIFEDYTVDRSDNKEFIMIEKREYNPELSVFSNMVLDLVDFKDRVMPLSNDIAMLEQASKYQKQNATQMMDERASFEQVLQDITAGVDPVEAATKKILGEGKPSAAAEYISSEPEAAEPDLELEQPSSEEPVEEMFAAAE